MPWALALHGGAGALDEARLPAERVARMRTDLQRALDRGSEVLAAGGSALDAVIEAISLLEDSPVFNAGHGAVLRSDGFAHLDASVMSGDGHRAGAVSLVRTPRNPARLARAVLERGNEVLLSGAAADKLAAELGHATQLADYFITEHRRTQLERVQRQVREGRAQREGLDIIDGAEAAEVGIQEEQGQTVGAVALDLMGHLAAATSTGGLTNASVGRVGDTPIIGAATWADDATCAVSATGAGEYFIRSAFAHEVHARMAFAGADLETAVRHALAAVQALGGQGGCVAIDAGGNVSARFTSPAMPRAYRAGTGAGEVYVLEPLG